MDAASRAAWRHAVAVMGECGDDPQLSADATTAYAYAVGEAAALRTEWEQAGRAGLRRGPRGGIAAEPLLLAIDRAERRASELRAVLGLDPASRRKLAGADGEADGRGERSGPRGAGAAAGGCCGVADLAG
jgi:hypothetical protein